VGNEKISFEGLKIFQIKGENIEKFAKLL